MIQGDRRVSASVPIVSVSDSFASNSTVCGNNVNGSKAGTLVKSCMSCYQNTSVQLMGDQHISSDFGLEWCISIIYDHLHSSVLSLVTSHINDQFTRGYRLAIQWQKGPWLYCQKLSNIFWVYISDVEFGLGLCPESPLCAVHSSSPVSKWSYCVNKMVYVDLCISSLQVCSYSHKNWADQYIIRTLDAAISLVMHS